MINSIYDQTRYFINHATFILYLSLKEAVVRAAAARAGAGLAEEGKVAVALAVAETVAVAWATVATGVSEAVVVAPSAR